MGFVVLLALLRLAPGASAHQIETRSSRDAERRPRSNQSKDRAR
jgi:hypothetical protein